MPTPVLSSAFRPFYFLGTLYAVLLTGAWLGAFLGHWEVPSVGTPLRLWHGHEMLFGFASAIIVGIVLTALPSWAGIGEIQGGRLALLVALWMAGRLAFQREAESLPTHVMAEMAGTTAILGLSAAVARTATIDSVRPQTRLRRA